MTQSAEISTQFNKCNKICLKVDGITDEVIFMIKVLENVISLAAGVIMSLSLEADTWRKGNNYFYGQFTFKVHRNVS